MKFDLLCMLSMSILLASTAYSGYVYFGKNDTKNAKCATTGFPISLLFIFLSYRLCQEPPSSLRIINTIIITLLGFVLILGNIASCDLITSWL